MTPNEMTRRAVDATLSLADVIDEENKALAQARVERVSACIPSGLVGQTC